MNQSINNFSIAEEIWHAITHGVGFFLGIAGLVILVVTAAYHSDALGITTSAIYGATLIVMYGSSTLYHSITNYRAKKLFQTFDHASIYILIAGSYTPISLLTLRGAWGWSIFGVNWGIAMIGVALKFLYPRRFEKLSLYLYVIMGWIVLIAFDPLIHNMPSRGLWLLVAGGLLYSFGIIFYIKDTKPYFHTIWHFFVLAGSICHYFAVLFYVV
ncbi:MAG: hemolysin III family protein [Epsilonproteobacteria bacterium]|nr:hemolysin III family protein [Campylobacterota bacterium]